MARSESGIISRITSEEWLKHPGSVGRANPPFHPLVLDEAGAECPPGVEGVLHFIDDSGQGSAITTTPRRRPRHMWFLARSLSATSAMSTKTAISSLPDASPTWSISGGVNIYPAECERILADHPSVHDVALFGIPDDEMGEQLVGLISLEGESTTPAVLIEFCRRSIANFKVPRASLGRTRSAAVANGKGGQT